MNFEKPRVAAIVPAYNEADRVVAVLDTIAAAGGVDEVLCVTDGCSDDTAAQVRRLHSNAPAQFALRAPL